MIRGVVKNFWFVLIAFFALVVMGITCCDHSGGSSETSIALSDSAFETCVVMNSTFTESSVYLVFTDGHVETKVIHVGENHLLYERTYVLSDVRSVNPLFVVVKNSNIWVLKTSD